MQTPVWVFRLGCTPYGVSNHVYNWLRLSTPTILLSSIVCYRYYNTRLNLALSSLVLLVTLVHRNYIAGSMPVLPLFATHIIFQLYSVECPHLTFLFLWDYYQCCVNPSLPVMISPCLAPLWTNQLISWCNTSLLEIIFLRLRTLCPFPGTFVSSLLILRGYQYVRLLLQLIVCLIIHQCVIPCCCQHTML